MLPAAQTPGVEAGPCGLRSDGAWRALSTVHRNLGNDVKGRRIRQSALDTVSARGMGRHPEPAKGGTVPLNLRAPVVRDRPGTNCCQRIKMYVQQVRVMS